jgi:hypothetical protein
MATHQWGDPNFDWSGLDLCISYIGNNLRRWGRVNVTQMKEKFGECRIYCSLGWHSLFSITHPGWVSYKIAGYPNWLMTFDIFVLSRIVSYLNFIILPYHKFLYHKLYSDCVKKYPHLHDEILDASDFPELLENL